MERYSYYRARVCADPKISKILKLYIEEINQSLNDIGVSSDKFEFKNNITRYQESRHRQSCL
ncbi:hypothetical protein [Campylobacter devanensis]|uniref:hypothetical protein n=1 Tax=Campylobacter devanensis TaxID=3161138 RepID=UPI000A344D29|nr:MULTISPECIES: hypothetical protein [unclassified Campylobacter]